MGLTPLLLLAGCAYGHAPVPAPAYGGDKDAKVVSAVWHVSLAEQWRASPWYRPEEDLVEPTRVIIATDESACLMGDEVYEPEPNQHYVCPSGWRRARHRGPR